MKVDQLGEHHSVYQIFAKNLQARVLERGSIAQTCLNLKINRQQFNKYMNGSMLPNEATMNKIVAYLGVNLAQLFEDQPSAQMRNRDGLGLHPTGAQRVQKLLNEIYAVNSQTSLLEGVYFCYLLWLPNLNYCLRSLIIVKRVDDRMVFTRMVRINDIGNSQIEYKSRLQEGVVTQTKEFVTLIGVEARQNYRKSILSFTQAEGPSHGCMGGLLNTYTPTGLPICCRVVIHYQGSTNEWRKYYKNSGMLPINAPTIRPDAAAIILKHFHDENAILQSYDSTQAWWS